jgi:hypothetical protein
MQSGFEETQKGGLVDDGCERSLIVNSAYANPRLAADRSVRYLFVIRFLQVKADDH